MKLFHGLCVCFTGLLLCFRTILRNCTRTRHGLLILEMQVHGRICGPANVLLFFLNQRIGGTNQKGLSCVCVCVCVCVWCVCVCVCVCVCGVCGVCGVCVCVCVCVKKRPVLFHLPTWDLEYMIYQTYDFLQRKLQTNDELKLLNSTK